MTRRAPAEPDAATVREIPTSALAVHPDNPRPAAGDVAELATSIVQVGVLNPLLVVPDPDRPDGYLVVCGSRRLAAANAAGVERVPCTVRVGLDPLTVATVALTDNLVRRELDPIEEARAYATIMDTHGLTQRELGDRIGVSQGHVSKYVRLLDLPDADRADVAAGRLSINQALQRLDKDPRLAKPHDGYPSRRKPPRPTPPRSERAATLTDQARTSSDGLVSLPPIAIRTARKASVSAGLSTTDWIVRAIARAARHELDQRRPRQ